MDLSKMVLLGRPRILCLGLVLAGCGHAGQVAMVDGRPVARVRLGYTDHHYFAVNHVDAFPRPRGPSSGLTADDGHIIGTVCGTQITLDSRYRHRYLSLSGFVQNAHESEGGMTRGMVDYQPKYQLFYGGGISSQRPAYLEVQDRGDYGGRRIISGYIGGSAGPGEVQMNDRPMHEVDLEVTFDRLRGVVGRRRFDLSVRGGDLVGTFEQAGKRVPFAVRDLGALWSLTPADQAAILPLMLSCDTETQIIQVVDLRTSRL
jgi:hypothetical protein